MEELASKLHVLLDGCIFGYQKSGGVSRIWARIIDEWVCDPCVQLAMILPRKVDNVHFKQQWLRTGVQCIFFPLNHPYHLVSRSWFRGRFIDLTLHRYGPFDIFHSTYFSHPRTGKVVSVTTVHDVIDEIRGKNPSVFSRWYLKDKRATLQRSQGLVCVSEATRIALLNQYPELSKNRVRVIHHAVDPAFRGYDMPVRTRFSPRILFVGQRRGYKNFSLLLDALRTYEHRQEIELVIAGGGELEREEMRNLQEAGICYCTFPRPNDETLALLYRDAMCLAYPSTQEGFGLPVVEAMASGCPVLCSDIPVLHEVGGDAVLYFHPQSAVDLQKQLVQVRDPPTRLRLIHAGFRRVANRTFGDTARELLLFYQDLLLGAGR
jgi:glycosyltransferase involved in cell wall biosynthesis